MNNVGKYFFKKAPILLTILLLCKISYSEDLKIYSVKKIVEDSSETNIYNKKKDVFVAFPMDSNMELTMSFVHMSGLMEIVFEFNNFGSLISKTLYQSNRPAKKIGDLQFYAYMKGIEKEISFKQIVRILKNDSSRGHYSEKFFDLPKAIANINGKEYMFNLIAIYDFDKFYLSVINLRQFVLEDALGTYVKKYDWNRDIYPSEVHFQK